MNKKILCFIIILFCFICTGCIKDGSKNTTANELKPFAVVKNYNTKKEPIEITFYKEPKRVVTFWQNSVETLLALGLEDKIVAAVGVPSIDCIKPEYRKAYEKIPLKQFKPLDVENILMLKPDLIIGWYSTFTDRYIKSTSFWQDRGINTFIAPSSIPNSKDKTVEGQYNYILSIGKIFGREKKAEKIVQKMKDEINYIQENTKNEPKQRVLILEKDKDELHTYGEKTLAGNILTHVGGELIKTGSTISYEELINDNPQVIFLVVVEEDYKKAPEIINSLYNNIALCDVEAIKNRRVFAIPLYMVYSSATRTYDGIRLMAKSLYPKLYKGRK